MCHLFDEVVEFATDVGQIGDVSVAQTMPVGSVFGERAAAAGWKVKE